MDFGAWAIEGGRREFGWRPQDYCESTGAIHRAPELRGNRIVLAGDGFGHSEEPAASCSAMPTCARAGATSPVASVVAILSFALGAS